MGKGGDKVIPKKELLIDGTFYDVTDFKHPGGSIIDYYAGKGIDATQSFHQFHIRSNKMDKYMKSLPNRAADAKEIAVNLMDDKQVQLLKDFDQFTNQLEKEGFFKPSIPHVIYRTLEIFCLYGLGIYLIKNAGGNMLMMALGIVSAAIAQGRCGWYMHEGGHYSLTSNPTIDLWLQIIFYGVGCGMSGGWWRIQHNKHHAMPQKVGYDVDLNTLPLVAFTSREIKKLPYLHKLWIRSQAVLFPAIITSLVALGWQFYLHPRFIWRKKDWREAACLVLRYVLWHQLFTTQFGLKQSILIYLAYDWVAANYIFIDFAVSHTHLPTVPKEDTKVRSLPLAFSVARFTPISLCVLSTVFR
jgi:acyl-CoA 6-desaturase (Delta-6 desaturase)